MTPVAYSAAKFSRALAFAAALAIVVVGVLIAVINEGAYNNQKQRELAAQTDVLRQSVVASLMFTDASAAQQSVTAMAANPEIDAIAVYEPSGAVLAAFERHHGSGIPKTGVLAEVRDGGLVQMHAPVVRDGRAYGGVYVRMRRDNAITRVGRYAPIGLLVLMAALVLGVAGAGQEAQRRANSELRAQADALALSNAALYAEMEQRKQAEEALLQSRKMEAIGRLTGGVAHDFNNLLMVISGGLRLLDRHSDPERRKTTADAMHQAVQRGAGLTRQLLAFSRRQAVQLEVIDIERQLSGMRELLERSLRADILLDISTPPDLPPIKADPGEFELAILNLCVNARDAMPKGGVLTITGRRGQVGGEPRVEVLVRDTGTGIPPEILDSIFEPYFTTKQVGQGTGLGLSQVYGFAQQNGGGVHVETQLGAGTTFILALPPSKEPYQRTEAAVRPAAVADPKRVLVVEDDDQVAATVCDMLDELGHSSRRAQSAAEALQVLRETPNFDLVFSDIVMPGGKSGVELARDLEATMPTLLVLLTTGYSGESYADVGRPVLRKPYQVKELQDAIAAVFRRRQTHVA